MTEPLTREQFRTAVADAVSGVLNVYREVDAMMRDLVLALSEGEPRFVPLIRRLVPGSGSKNPDARYLRNYQAAIFVPADAGEEDDDDDDADSDTDDTDADDEDADEEVESPKTAKRALTLKVGSALLVARVAIYDRPKLTFEPTLMVGVLTRCRVSANTPAGTVLKTKAGRFKKIFRAIDAHTGGAGTPVMTAVTAQVVGGAKSKSKNSKLTFDAPTPIRTYPLFEINADHIRTIAGAARDDWGAALGDQPAPK